MWFEEAPALLVQTCENTPHFLAAVEVAYMVRDARGNIRLALKLNEGWRHKPRQGSIGDAAGSILDLAALETSLERELQQVVALPVLVSGPQAHNRVLEKLAGTATNWTPTWSDPITGEQEARGTWRKLERRLGKADWLEENHTPRTAWEHGAGPTIVTFYSFKGGVGRTTLLTATAWHLASRGHHVAVVDLDLEAPGLSAVFEAPSDRGLIDALIMHAATSQIQIAPLLKHPTIFDDAALNDRCLILPAGQLDLGYIEKLARLDYLREENEDSPVTSALRATLGQLRGSLGNDPRAFILVDARAGLHDLSGIALHGLAHLEVLVGRASEQTYAGFDVAIAALSRWHTTADLRMLMVQTMAPPEPGSELYLRETRTFADHAYSSMNRHFYERDIESEAEYPAPDDPANQPLVIRYAAELERPQSFRNLRARLFQDDFTAFVDRLLELSANGGES